MFKLIQMLINLSRRSGRAGDVVEVLKDGKIDANDLGVILSPDGDETQSRSRRSKKVDPSGDLTDMLDQVTRPKQ